MKKVFDDSSDFSDFLVAPPMSVPAGSLGGTYNPAPPVLGAPLDVPAETLEAEAAITASGTGTTGSTVAVGSSAGLTINLEFDSAAMAAPQSFRDGITQAMQMICAVVTDHITLNIQIDYSGTGGGAAAGPTNGNYVSYSTVRADLVNTASSGDTTFNSLPAGSTIAGQSQVAVWYAQEKLWGLISPTGTEVDGSATFATDIDPSLLVGVALHELTHAMGRVPYAGNTGQPDIFDFFRYTSAGNLLVNGNSTAPAAYFSLDGGNTKLADYGRTSDPSDFLNSGVQGSTDPFNEFYSNSTQQSLTAMDLKQLDALGFHLAAPVTPKPDLTEYVALNTTSVAPGGSLTIDAYDMNLGNAVAPGSTAQIYLSTDPTITTSDTVLATITNAETLATVNQPGYYDHQTVTVNLPGNLAPGTYYVGGIADYNNHVIESNETNNTYNVVKITVGPTQPDLSEYVALNTTSVASNGSLTIDAYDMNLGNAVAPGSTAQIYLSTDPTITTSDTVLATVTNAESLATVGQPGYYDHQTVTVSLPGNLAPGTYYVGGIADYNNHVIESNETNNTYNVVQITVTGPAQPDLSEYVAVNTTSVAPGGSLTIDAYDMNLGNAVAPGSTAQIYLSTTPTITTSDTVLATVTNTESLSTVSQPGYYDHQTITVNLPGNLAPGTYYVAGIADYNNQVIESNESNNTYNVVQITVGNPTTPSATTMASAGNDNFKFVEPANLGGNYSPAPQPLASDAAAFAAASHQLASLFDSTAAEAQSLHQLAAESPSPTVVSLGGTAPADVHVIQTDHGFIIH